MHVNRMHGLPAGRPSQAPSLLRQVMASSQQESQKIGGQSLTGVMKPGRGVAKAKQGPSKLDALFSQLHTPVKGLKPPKSTRAAPEAAHRSDDKTRSQQAEQSESPIEVVCSSLSSCSILQDVLAAIPKEAKHAYTHFASKIPTDMSVSEVKLCI